VGITNVEQYFLCSKWEGNSCLDNVKNYKTLTSGTCTTIGELIILKSRKTVYRVKLYKESRFLIEPVLQDTGTNQHLIHKAETNIPTS
jgi:hypothetical protein